MPDPAPVDIHLHLLPGVDDGPSHSFETLEMLEALHVVGSTRVATTPHLTGPLSEGYAAVVSNALSSTRELAARFGIDVVQGYEVMLTPDVPERLAAGEPIRLADSRSLLVELPFGFWPEHSATTIFGIQAANFNVILAHPERYAVALHEPERVLRLAEQGVVMQVTYASLVGVNGRGCRTLAERFLRECPLVVLATDAHSNGARLHAVEEGFSRAAQIVGYDRAVQMANNNSAALLDDQPLPEQVELKPLSEQLSLFERLKRL
jgi:protein-tyrosine phosphatase